MPAGVDIRAPGPRSAASAAARAAALPTFDPTPRGRTSNTGRGAADMKDMTLRDLLIGRSLGRSLIRGLAVGVLLLLGSQFLLMPVRAHGISMVPTYEEGQLVYVNRLAYRFGPVRRGDIVAISLKSGEAVLVKRIIALPGERVAITNGTVTIDGRPLDEPYCKFRLAWNILETQLGPDEVFVIGDNRSMKEEFHTFGRAPASRILGRMIN
jgi:signal peptidase I